jgi:hypothetical protein
MVSVSWPHLLAKINGTLGKPSAQLAATVENAIRDADEWRPTTEHPLPAIPGQGHWKFLLPGLYLRE